VGLPTVGPLAIRPPDEKGVDVSLNQYSDLAISVNRNHLGVYLFWHGPPSSVNGLRAIVQPSIATGGLAYIYHELDFSNLHMTLFETITGSYLRAVQVRLRCSNGIAITSVSGNVVIRDQTVRVPVLNAHSGLAFELRVEEELKVPQALFQAATLWSDDQDRPIIRIMTFGIPVTNQPALIKASIDEGAMAVCLLKRAANLLSQHPSSETVSLLQRTFAGLTVGARFSSLYHLMHGLFGSPLLRVGVQGGEEGRIMEMVHTRAASLVSALLYMYPRVFVLDNGKDILPSSADAFVRGYILLVHSWNQLYLWVNPEVPKELALAFFGSETVPLQVPQIETEQNRRLNEVIAECYALSGKYLPVQIIPPGDPRMSVFRELLVDSSLASGSDFSGFLTSVYH
jgi:hypothetical protein